MGRKLILAFALLLAGCGSSQHLESEIVLLPHHLLVENRIVEMYESLASTPWDRVVIVSPNHFYLGSGSISPAVEGEHGFTIHRDFAQRFFPSASVEGYMIQNTATSDELDLFLADLLEAETEKKTKKTGSTLTIFTIDFSHYLPGQIAYVHDLRAIDVLLARDLESVRSLEVDSPATAELLIKMLLAKSAILTDIVNTNPSKDIGVETFENTTHVFARSIPLASTDSPTAPPTRKLFTEMFFAYPREWYLGRTLEDRYLYGYDEMHFDQGGTDRAIVNDKANGSSFELNFDYFDEGKEIQ